MVNWALQPAGDLPAMQVTQDAGLSFRAYKPQVLTVPAVGVLRLRAQPDSFRQPIKAAPAITR